MMKKIVLPLLVLTMVMTSIVSCSNSQEKDNSVSQDERMAKIRETKAKRDAEMKQAWASFDTMSIDSKKKFISEQKKKIDRRDSIQAARRAEMEKKWAGFDTMPMERQVELLKERGVMPRPNVDNHQHQHQGHQHPGQNTRKKHQHGPNCKHDHKGDAKYNFKEVEHHHK